MGMQPSRETQPREIGLAVYRRVGYIAVNVDARIPSQDGLSGSVVIQPPGEELLVVPYDDIRRGRLFDGKSPDIVYRPARPDQNERFLELARRDAERTANRFNFDYSRIFRDTLQHARGVTSTVRRIVDSLRTR